MSKARPALDPHKLRWIRWGNGDMDSSTAMTADDRSWSSSTHPLRESDSGSIILITTAADGARTFTLPSAKKGLYFKFVWGVSDTNNSGQRNINTASAAEEIRGAVLAFDSDTANSSNDIAATRLSSNDAIQIVDDISIGSYLELVSDGDHWYTAENKLILSAGGSGVSGD